MIRLPPPGPHIPPTGPVSRGSAPIRHALLVFPGFPLMAFSAVMEPLRAANLLAGRPVYDWVVVTDDAEPLRASNGLRIEPDHGAATAPDADRIIVCSGGDAENLKAGRALSWIRRQIRMGASVGAVADAAFFLARAGLLDSYACTLHWTSQPAFREAFPEIDMRPDLFVIDRDRFTSSGGIGALDMMLALISADCGAELARAVAEWFVHSPLRRDADRQRMLLRLRTGVRDEMVLSAIAAMEQALEEPVEIRMLAARMGVSADRLERAFQRETGLSPSAYLRRLRLKHAADLLTHSSSQIDAVALSCGFVSASSFSRAFRLEFGCTPRQMRARRAPTPPMRH
ncbi:MAG: GlxA family transcriptional regulator [Gemmobacter sp.]|jgi:transcriptional regulator GlxA family with amidase domain|nr:GlxA family transcriptional regulator [Gemmobacter sp.]